MLIAEIISTLPFGHLVRLSLLSSNTLCCLVYCHSVVRISSYCLEKDLKSFESREFGVIVDIRCKFALPHQAAKIAGSPGGAAQTSANLLVLPWYLMITPRCRCLGRFYNMRLQMLHDTYVCICDVLSNRYMLMSRSLGVPPANRSPPDCAATGTHSPEDWGRLHDYATAF